jgi:DNA-binding Lrp family transcriptional regulator
MDEVERKIINGLQAGIPVSERPYADAAESLGLTEDELIRHLVRLRDQGIFSRVGPMYYAEGMGGGLTLAAMKIDEKDFDRVACQVDVFPEVAHNYERGHEFNMWFVVATENSDDVEKVLAKIEQRTGYKVYNMPKLQEFYIGLRLEV